MAQTGGLMKLLDKRRLDGDDDGDDEFGINDLKGIKNRRQVFSLLRKDIWNSIRQSGVALLPL